MFVNLIYRNCDVSDRLDLKALASSLLLASGVLAFISMEACPQCERLIPWNRKLIESDRRSGLAAKDFERHTRKPGCLSAARLLNW